MGVGVELGGVGDSDDEEQLVVVMLLPVSLAVDEEDWVFVVVGTAK